ncbi:MAG: segregation/condensation protein A [Patescibacteria group bacterium]
MSYEVSIEKFSGPLDLLLTLIEKEELPISEVSLAQVTGDYLKFINENNVPAEELADFLTVAARLLLIKSNSILPVPLEEAVEQSNLAAQLRLYRTFVDVAGKLENMYLGGAVLFARPYVPLPVEVGFRPPENVTTNVLAEAFRGLIKRLEPFFALRQASLERVASVEERIRDIHEAIMKRARFMFSDVVGAAKSRAEVVVSFLALLELVKQRIIKVQQPEAFEEIVLTRNE